MNIDFVLSQTDPQPMYRQIMERIEQRISVGDWLPGDRLPSIRELAVALKVSVITVKRAYLELERAGVILTRQGKGSFVAAADDLGLRLRRQELDQMLDKVVELGAILGMASEELQDRLRDAAGRSKVAQIAKEPK